jgi:hypothetical protein
MKVYRTIVYYKGEKASLGNESCCCSDKAENMGYLPSTYLLTPQQFQKNTPTKNKIKTPNQ